MALDLKTLARMGAKARLDEIAAERAALLKQFPDLARKTKAPKAPAAETAPEAKKKQKKTRKRNVSPEQRAAASARMKAYWEKRKNA